MGITVKQGLDALRYVDHPDLKKDLVTLNMVQDVTVNGLDISFTIVLTSPTFSKYENSLKPCMRVDKTNVDKSARVKNKITNNGTTRKEKNETTLRGVKN